MEGEGEGCPCLQTFGCFGRVVEIDKHLPRARDENEGVGETAKRLARGGQGVAIEAVTRQDLNALVG